LSHHFNSGNKNEKERESVCVWQGEMDKKIYLNKSRLRSALLYSWKEGQFSWERRFWADGIRNIHPSVCFQKGSSPQNKELPLGTGTASAT
jgi:hypothetical protein